jgi:hypothetical protein
MRRLCSAGVVVVAVAAAIPVVSPTGGHLVRHAIRGVALAETPSQKVVGYHDKGEDIHYCDGCTPPLTNTGGSVVNTTGPAGFTVTPIFWEPGDASTANQIPASYQQIITGYVRNVAAASGRTSNVYSIATEYSQTIHGVRTPISYKITAGAPIVDHSPLPRSGCRANGADGYTSCITDAQLRTELTKVLGAHGVPSDLAHFYPMFFPPHTETQGAGAHPENSDSDYCGYHGAFVNRPGETLYGNEPYEFSSCNGGQSPNGNLLADGAVGVLSHELSETMTDPNGSGILGGAAWGDSTGHEIGDECSGFYGRALGSTDPAHPGTTAYNQVINGGKYYTQTEFSNTAYAKLGVGNGCQQNDAAATKTPTAASTNIGAVINDSYPDTVAANGKAKSKLDISVVDRAGRSVAGDQIEYSVYAITGNGYCGHVSAKTAKTNDGGHAFVTYTASRSNVICAVVANELDGGQGATGMIYQGSYQSQAIKATHAFPRTLKLGITSHFQTDFENPSSVPAADARIQFVVFPGDDATDNINASQMNLAYSTTGAHGTYIPVHLNGSTVVDGAIQGVVLPLKGVTIRAHQTLRVYYRITLKPTISTKRNGAGVAFESYLDQVNPASGALSTFADTLARQATVRPNG